MSKKPVALVLETFSYRSVFAAWIAALILFAAIYYFLSYSPVQGPKGIDGTSIERMYSSLYYSVITSTNTGYGDIVPIGISRLFASLQAFIGLFLVAVFISKLLTHKQNEIMHTLRELTLSNRLRGIREDLYLARVDFGSVSETVKNSGQLAERDWHILALAIKQCALQLEDMSELLAHQETLEGTLARKDTVIVEATQRTLLRLTDLLTLLIHSGIVWHENQQVRKEVSHVRIASSALLSRWKKYAHKDARIMLNGIEESIENLN